MARVLLATFGSLGDLHPYIAVGRALQARGVAARIATSADYQSHVEAAGLEFARVAPSLAELGTPAELARRVSNGLRGTQVLIQDLLMPHLRESHQQLRAAAQQADLLISHPLTFMLQVVAAEQRKPWLSSILAPASFLSRTDPPAMAPINSLQIAQRLGPWVYHGLLRLARASVRRWERPLHEYRRELGLPVSRQVMMFEGQFSPRGTLALFDAALMRPQPDWPPNTRVCGTPLVRRRRTRSAHARAIARIPGRRRPPPRVCAGLLGGMAGRGILAAGYRRRTSARTPRHPDHGGRRAGEPAPDSARVQLPAVFTGVSRTPAPSCIRPGSARWRRRCARGGRS